MRFSLAHVFNEKNFTSSIMSNAFLNALHLRACNMCKIMCFISAFKTAEEMSYARFREIVVFKVHRFSSMDFNIANCKRVNRCHLILIISKASMSCVTTPQNTYSSLNNQCLSKIALSKVSLDHDSIQSQPHPHLDFDYALG